MLSARGSGQIASIAAVPVPARLRLELLEARCETISDLFGRNIPVAMHGQTLRLGQQITTSLRLALANMAWISANVGDSPLDMKRQQVRDMASVKGAMRSANSGAVSR